MMGAAENISDLRTLLSIVAEETGALKMSDADEDSVGRTTEGQLPMTFGNVRRAYSALAALEAALSAAASLEAAATAVDKAWREKGGINCTEVCAIIRSALSAQVQDVAGLLDETWNAAVEKAAAIANDCVHLTPDPGTAIRTMLNGRTKLLPAAPAKHEGGE